MSASSGMRTRRLDAAARAVTGAFAWGLAASLPLLLMWLLVSAVQASFEPLWSALGASVSFVVLGLTLAAPLALLAAIWLEDEQRSRWARELAEANLVALAATPVFVFALPVVALVGIMPARSQLALAAPVLMLAMFAPLLTSARAAIVEVSASEREAGLALGGTRARVIWHVVLPAAGRGLLAGLLSAFARGLGYTAPLVVLLALLDLPAAGGSGGLTLSLFETLAPTGEGAWAPETGAAAALLLALASVGLDGVGRYLRRSAPQRRGGRG